MKRASVNSFYVVILLIGLGLVYVRMSTPETAPVDETKPTLVKIGVITSTTQKYQIYEPYIKEIIEKDVNQYAESVGSPIRFEFIIRDAEGHSAIHLEKMQEFHSINVSLVLGGMWSSQACASLAYSNNNDMLLVSPSSTSSHNSIPHDNLFKLAPSDLKMVPAMVSILESKEVSAVVVIQRGDSWADGISEKFQPLFEQSGGKVIENIRYPAESTTFEQYLELAENSLAEAVDDYGWDHVAVQLLSFDEAVFIFQQARSYPTLYNVTWYGSDVASLSSRIEDEAPEDAAHLVLYGFKPILLENEETDEFLTRFQEATNTSCDFYTATSYDIAMLLARSVIEFGGDDVEAVKEAFREISYDYVGITGLCRLDEADSRDSCIYAILGYAENNNEVGSFQFGIASEINEITWFKELKRT